MRPPYRSSPRFRLLQESLSAWHKPKRNAGFLALSQACANKARTPLAASSLFSRTGPLCAKDPNTANAIEFCLSDSIGGGFYVKGLAVCLLLKVWRDMVWVRLCVKLLGDSSFQVLLGDSTFQGLPVHQAIGGFYF